MDIWNSNLWIMKKNKQIHYCEYHDLNNLISYKSIMNTLSIESVALLTIVI